MKTLIAIALIALSGSLAKASECTVQVEGSKASFQIGNTLEERYKSTIQAPSLSEAFQMKKRMIESGNCTQPKVDACSIQVIGGDIYLRENASSTDPSHSLKSVVALRDALVADGDCTAEPVNMDNENLPSYCEVDAYNGQWWIRENFASSNPFATQEAALKFEQELIRSKACVQFPSK